MNERLELSPVVAAAVPAPVPLPAAVKPIVSVKDLRVEFRRPQTGEYYPVVNGVSFDIMPGEVVGIVGESGSGKSMTARSILKLVPKGGRLQGSIRYDGREVFDMPAGELRHMRGDRVAMVFQDAMTSFNPVMTVGEQISEAVSIHKKMPGAALFRRVLDLLGLVGIPKAKERASAYPHEFSGGMRQRALIAMAVANDPALLIADEPTTALDVTVQDQIMQLMRDLNTQSQTAILLITHNIAVVSSLCTRIIVMYAGRVVEDGPVEKILTNPEHPYTWSLLKSVPRLDVESERLVAIKGQPPDPQALPTGCKFNPRCPFVQPRCLAEEPTLDAVEPNHRARCWVLMHNVEDKLQ